MQSQLSSVSSLDSRGQTNEHSLRFCSSLSCPCCHAHALLHKLAERSDTNTHTLLRLHKPCQWLPSVPKGRSIPLFVLVIGHVLILQLSLPVSPLMYNTLHTHIRSLFSHYVLFALFVSLSLFLQQHQCPCDKGFESLFNSQSSPFSFLD